MLKISQSRIIVIKYPSSHQFLILILGRYKYVTRDEGEGNYYIALELTSPQNDDAATYKVDAKNAHGQSSAALILNFGGELH